MVRLSLKKFIYLILLVLIFIPIINVNFYHNSIFLNTRTPSESIETSNGYLSVDLSFLPEIDYVHLNELWYDPKIEMLIITPNKTDFIDAVKPLMEWKNEKGVKTIILSNFSLYEGVDDAEKIRNMIKSYYETENIQWVLLAGDAQDDLIPIRYVYNPDVDRYGDGRTETVGDNEYKPTDYYYADLDGTWDSDQDGEWGESPLDNLYGLDEISWDPEVYVGRFPANNALELEIMVNKTLKYESNPEIGNWMHRMLLAGGISDYPSGEDPNGEYESFLTSYIVENYIDTSLQYTHLIEEAGNLTQAVLRTYFNDGYSTVLMAGHGLPTSYFRNPSRAGYTSSDAIISSNDDKPSLVYLDACSTSSYDTTTDNSIGEILIKRTKGGAIGAIGGLRVTWYLLDDYNLEKLNRGNAKLFWQEFYLNKKFQQGKALYDSKLAYINSDYFNRGETATYFDFERKQLLTYCLLGDPEVDIYTNTPKSALNPFIENIYEGELVSVIIKDSDDKVVPFARVHIQGSGEKYFTTYADEDGLVKFRIPNEEYEDYNVSITGHNLVPSYFNFTALPDNTLPEVISVECCPKNPKTSVLATFNIQVQENKSGIESTYICYSKSNFSDYNYYGSSNIIEENNDLFQITIEKLKPGKYSYFIVLRDYANNTNVIYNTEFFFSIPQTMIDYLIPLSIVMIIFLGGISIFFIYIGLKRYAQFLSKN
ncbi:MAG: C25 family cysteine peptidase [Promethearchaeota archaeon]